MLSKEELLARKKELEIDIQRLNTKQHCVKIFLNSTYGAFANPHFPIGDDDIAASITLTGQATIKQAHQLAVSYFKEQTSITDQTVIDRLLVASDTDSVFISLKDLLQHKGIEFSKDGKITPEAYKIINELGETINNNIKVWARKFLNSKDCRLEFKREKAIDVGMFLEKKRYVVHILDDEGIPCDKWKYTGVEVVRTTMPKPIKPYVKKIIETLISTQDRDTTNKVYEEAYRVFNDLPVEDISFTTSISNYDKYATTCNEFSTVKGMPVHVKAAYFHNLLLKKHNIHNTYESINSGDKIKWFYLDKPNKYGIDAIAFKYKLPHEFKEIFKVDRQMMFDKIIFSAIKKYYEAVNWHVRKPSEAVQTELFDFFN